MVVAALLFASGMVQDDVEEQTLTYLLIRPVPERHHRQVEPKEEVAA